MSGLDDNFGASVTVKAAVRIKTYAVIRNAIDCSGMAAIRRFYKHRDDNPFSSDNEAEEMMIERDLCNLDNMICEEVMTRLSAVLNFEENEQ